ncbi:unnamed protein product [Mytilus coruscus]|uniref:RNase H type-1 domain-containing protein n=1 Tax=Mytilus coruscus TaxID=42192 RepID=A0A6J8B290_MYTCO|nr:unnamed protein product [Mytilus coruscus]
MMFLIDWSSPDCVLFCDSTLVGCGGICNGRYFHTVFPAFIRRKQLHINALELLCGMECLKVWASVLDGSKIVIYYDNSSSVTVLNSGACRNAFMQSCLREICFLTASHEFQVKGRHLSGEANRVADMLSRWDMDPGISTEFLKQARINSWTEIELLGDFLFILFIVDTQLRKLQKDTELCKKSAFAEGTYKNLKVQFVSYFLFCTYFNMSPLPILL